MANQANPPAAAAPARLLAEGTPLDAYRIARVLDEGGFSVVYLAHDAGGTPVVIKEFRVAGADPARFAAGMKSFFEEGRALAGLQHPNVVRVLNFFRANDTAYLVMRHEEGRTLKEHIQGREGPLEELWMRTTFAQLLAGLREVHARKLLHLDIKPANIYLRTDGTPLLIDFGAARQALSGEGTRLPPTFTPGFAAPEQHVRGQALGPWTDIYAVGATLYACFAAAAPQPANARLEKDVLVPARKAWAGKYPDDLLGIVDWCLRLDPLERPQSVFELQKVLLGEKPPARAQAS